MHHGQIGAPDQLTTLVSSSQALNVTQQAHGNGSPGPSLPQRHRTAKKRRPPIKVRSRLPLLLVKHTWEFALRESEGCWTFGVHPVNYRPSNTPAFHFVQIGDVAALENLLSAGELSVWDVLEYDYGPGTLLGVWLYQYYQPGLS